MLMEIIIYKLWLKTNLEYEVANPSEIFQVRDVEEIGVDDTRMDGVHFNGQFLFREKSR